MTAPNDEPNNDEPNNDEPGSEEKINDPLTRKDVEAPRRPFGDESESSTSEG